MAAGKLTANFSPDGSRIPIILIGLVAILIAAANAFADPLIGVAAVIGICGATFLAMRPAYAVTLLLGAFLVTYPWWLQGRGVLTLNNVLGAWLGLLMAYRMWQSGDWSLLRNRELLLMFGIAAVLLFSRIAQRPDDHTMEIVAPLIAGEYDPARVIISRLVFFVFFLYFIRTPQQVRMIFLLAVTLMVLSGFAAIWMVLTGGGFEGYRARSGMFIAAGGNPNRLALTAVIGIISLWYLMQWLRNSLATLAISLVIGVLVLAVFMAGSRSGVVALGLGTAILFYEGGLSPRKIILGALAGLMAAMLVVRAAPEKSIERLSSLPGLESSESDLGAGSVERRGYTAALAVELAQRNPLFGVGVGNWEITRYLTDPAHHVTPPHSAVLLALAEGGIVTLVLYIILLTRTLRHFLDSASALSGPEHSGYVQWMAKSLRASFIVFLAMSLVGDLWLNILFYWFVGLGVTLSRVIFEPEEATEPGEEPVLVGATA